MLDFVNIYHIEKVSNKHLFLTSVYNEGAGITQSV